MNTNQAIIVSIGGRTIEIESVLLHSATAVAKWQGLHASAQPLLAGFSSGIGIWGSPGIALAGAFAIGLMEAAASNANQKRGFQLLVEAYALAERLKPRGVMVPIGEIEGVEHPSIVNWKASGLVQSELDVRQIGMFEKKSLRNDHGATDAEIASGFIVRETMQVLGFFPDDYVTAQSGGKRILIKWASIDFYEVVQK
jgi:hypothetical protein